MESAFRFVLADSCW